MPVSEYWQGNLSIAVANGSLSQGRLDGMATRYVLYLRFMDICTDQDIGLLLRGTSSVKILPTTPQRELDYHLISLCPTKLSKEGTQPVNPHVCNPLLKVMLWSRIPTTLFHLSRQRFCQSLGTMLTPRFQTTQQLACTRPLESSLSDNFPQCKSIYIPVRIDALKKIAKITRWLRRGSLHRLQILHRPQRNSPLRIWLWPYLLYL